MVQLHQTNVAMVKGCGEKSPTTIEVIGSSIYVRYCPVHLYSSSALNNAVAFKYGKCLYRKLMPQYGFEEEQPNGR